MRKRIRSSAAQKKESAATLERKWRKHLSDVQRYAEFSTRQFLAIRQFAVQDAKE